MSRTQHFLDCRCKSCVNELLLDIDSQALELASLKEQLAAKDRRIEKLETALTEIRDAETDCCPRCIGNGAVYADGKAHYMSENAPTVACPDCLGEGRIPPADAGDIAEQALGQKGE